jgi:heme oxygenase
LGVNELVCDEATRDYLEYLKGLSQENANAHIYLNYLAIMFGGQMMKKNTPGSGKMYDFENMRESMESVRAIQKDEWADEVNKGFDFMIKIFKNLEGCLTIN